MNCWTCSQ